MLFFAFLRKSRLAINHSVLDKEQGGIGICGNHSACSLRAWIDQSEPAISEWNLIRAEYDLAVNHALLIFSGSKWLRRSIFTEMPALIFILYTDKIDNYGRNYAVVPGVSCAPWEPLCASAAPEAYSSYL